MSLRKAIDEKCKDCIYDKGAPGTWRQQVEACAITSCSLHEFRPMMLPVRDTAKKAVFETEGGGVATTVAGIRRLVRNVTKSGRSKAPESILDMEPA